MPLAAELFDYTLPSHLVAQTPAGRRDQSKLLVVNRTTRTIAHHRFQDLPSFLSAGDVLIRNNAAMLPARLHGLRPTGGQVECFLLRPTADAEIWECLLKPGKKLPVGATFAHASGEFTGTITKKDPSSGSAFVRFSTRNDQPIDAVANRLGDVPLPPYIERPDKSRREFDLERYQTVYAETSRRVAVAAPTAGLHFTPELLATLATHGIKSADITLHVGLGTFKPITTPTIEAHAIHREIYELPVATQRVLFPPLTGRRVAVGTTSVRSIEDFLGSHDAPLEKTQVSETGIFIYPPCRFRGVDALITNFHQPRSTLLCLVAAFLAPGSTEGISWLHEIYREAIAHEYRFFSYGDAMLIL
ncbi:MAG TPA: tRNA preQ1(34) S-adenosylmethionine ribosyltransferase-isomerase QueA [Opitutaceae bacterium]|nr:tRNA preQ1(34) S-adenosylmethionine ribosyltransferase-isomerase QueA [Opitutaceae bacterium]